MAWMTYTTYRILYDAIGVIIHSCVNLSYRLTFYIRRTLVGNKIVDHSDVVGASPVGAAPTTFIFILDFTRGFNGLDRDNCETRRE